MLFNSIVFLYYFLPILIVLYFGFNNKYRNILLLIASIWFYAYGEKKFIFILLISMLVNHFGGIILDQAVDKKRKIFLVLGISFNLGILFLFKYLNFSISIFNSIFGDVLYQTKVRLPIGISFYTFQAISYLVDVYRRECHANKKITNTFLYLSFFPQLVAGPIVRYQTIAAEINDRKENWDDFSLGIKRFIIGLGKKTILANQLAVVSEYCFQGENAATLSMLMAWLGAICYTLQIFFDFSGYSDMAIGLGRMFGFHFEENFNYPYISKSITEFWRRWHISLSSWFRDYVYIPIGGSRVKAGRHILNLFVVWLLTGVWHGANYTFILWGLGYFVLLVLEKFVIKPESKNGIIFMFIYRIGTLLSVILLWVIFNSLTLDDALIYIKSMFVNIAYEPKDLYWIKEYGVIICLAVVFSTPIVKKISDKVKSRYLTIYNVVTPIIYLFIFAYSLSFLAIGAHNPFIYFNF